jgi:hypothetical protein
MCSRPGSSRPPNIEWAFVWVIVYGCAAVAFLVATLTTFNRCLGRVETGLPALGARRREPVVLLRVDRAVREPSEIA